VTVPIGAAIGGALGAAGSIGGALIGSSASKDASQAQMQLGRESLANQNALFSKGLGLIQPFVDVGASGIGALNDWLDPSKGGLPLNTLMKLLTPGADMTETLSQIPGFKFAQDWGQKAVQNIGSTMGFGGNTLKAGADYATGKAQEGFGGITSMLLNLFGGGANALQARVTSGASAAGSAFGNATQTGANMGGTLTGIGNASAAGTLGSANALAGGLTGATGSVTNAVLLSKLLGGNSSKPNNNTGIYSPDNPNENFAGFGPTYFSD
jgi:hypothetical protein